MRTTLYVAVVTVALAGWATGSGAQATGIPWLCHGWIKCGEPDPTALIEIGDPDGNSPGRYTMADVAYALPSSFTGINLPPHGVLALYPPFIFWFRPAMAFRHVGPSQGYYWTSVLARFPTCPTILRGLTFDVQVLAYKKWHTGTVSRLSSKATFYLY